jgi:predicted RNase H-like HicB family nuclease
MRVKVQANFMLFGVVKRKGDWYVAHCPPLDIATQGKTLGEAKANLIEASELFITSCLERGTLDQALRELGFVPFKAGPRNVPKAFPIAIPIPFGFEKSFPCHA